MTYQEISYFTKIQLDYPTCRQFRASRTVTVPASKRPVSFFSVLVDFHDRAKLALTSETLKPLCERNFLGTVKLSVEPNSDLLTVSNALWYQDLRATVSHDRFA